MRGEGRWGGGESGIRTRGGLLTHTRFPGVRLKPLIHPSEAWKGSGAILCAPGHPFAPTLSSVIAVPIKVATSVMLPGTIIVLLVLASCW